MTEPRLKRTALDDRTDRVDERLADDRAYDDRAMTEDRALSDRELRDLLRNQMAEAKLPNPPARPGVHFAWLSSTNESDTIATRMRLGYVPAVKEDVPDGFPLDVSEMRLFKISEDRYQAIMYLQHHEAPFESERDIKARAKDGVGQLRGRISEENDGDDSGFDIEEPRRGRPRFS